MWLYPKHWQAEDLQTHTHTVLLEMAETNYRRMQRLIPNLDVLPDHVVSRVDGCMDLHLHIMDRWTYTTHIKLTYCFSEEIGGTCQPDLDIRLYHDALAAEPMSAILHKAGLISQHDPSFTLHHKWMLNRFLYKWLGYCLRQGHRFTQAAVDAEVVEKNS